MFNSRKKRHIRFVSDSIYNLRYSLLNDAILLHRGMGRDDLDRLIIRMSIKSKRLVRYNRYLRLLTF